MPGIRGPGGCGTIPRGIPASTIFVMAHSPWLILRQAREALRAGRPDEAHRLIEPLAAEGYRQAVKLTRDVAQAYLTRAVRHLDADNADAAWLDLLLAETLLPGSDDCIKLRHTLTRLGLAECRAALEAGHPLTVIESGIRLRERWVNDHELSRLEEAAQEWLLAADQADRGEFLLAQTTLERAKTRIAAHPLVGAGLQLFSSTLVRRHEQFLRAIAALTEANNTQRWDDALRAADEATAAAPDHRETRRLRSRAWDVLHPVAHTLPWNGNLPDGVVPLAIASGVGDLSDDASRLPRAARAAPATKGLAAAVTACPSSGLAPQPKRFLLWIDGVGGYLVCLAPRVTFGQAVHEGPVDVPLFAEMSRLHAELVRDGEGYVFESARGVMVNEVPVQRAVLRHGDRLTLGPTCQLAFHLPVPISPSARLQLASGHRLPLAIDGVLLMAEALILGPGEQVHVPLPTDAVGNVVIHRTKGGLGVRLAGDFQVDNRPCLNRADLPLPCVVTSDAVTFAVEPVGPRL